MAAILGAVLSLAAVGALAQANYWSDSFETNAGSRWTTNGVWKIGAPTAGPGSAFGGSKCGGTGLTAGAPLNANARFICTNYFGATNLTIPAASFSPRLRFWQWYDFVNAEGFVELRQAGATNWQTISATNLSFAGTANTGGGVWSEPSLDLSAFAGAQVQIAFHFISGANYGNDPGWYVDDVAVVTNVPVFDNPENFMNGLGDWAVDGGTWQAGKPTSGPGAAPAGAGMNCAGTVLAGAYGANTDSRLISPPFTVPATLSPVVLYWQWYGFINAQGFVEINNGTASTAYTTNLTITTNLVFAGLNTNVYQLAGAAVPDYANPLYWNPTIGGWTNATKAMGVVDDIIFKGGFYFEAGTAPLLSVGSANVDYALNNLYPQPPTAAATNYLSWQGQTWNSTTDGNDNPVGYFGTHYSYTYTTNITVTGFENGNWTPLSQTNSSFGSTAVNSGGWTNASLDLSAYAGQTVQIAFHFQSGAGGYGSAAGWYLDGIGLGALPILTVPTSGLTVAAGNILMVTNVATLNPTNNLATFKLLAGPTNGAALNATNGVLTWKVPAAQAPGIYTNIIKLADANGLSATNTFFVTVVPAAPKISLASGGGALKNGFRFSFQTASNTAWRIDASTNLVNWLPVLTNVPGAASTLQFTDLLATNFPLRYYRAVFP